VAIGPAFSAEQWAAAYQASLKDPYADVPKGPYFSPINPEINWGTPQQSSPAPPPTPAPSPSPTYSPSPPPPPPTPPDPWQRTPSYAGPKGVKQAEPDIVLDPEIDASGDFIVERFFEELGGTELIKLSRYDLIDGINVSYSPIANLSSLRRRYNPNNIIALDILAESEFAKASIDLLSRGPYEPYFDDNGDLVIEVDIIRPEENIEAQISQSGTVSRIDI
jgi:hypothetical protein